MGLQNGIVHGSILGLKYTLLKPVTTYGSNGLKVCLFCVHNIGAKALPSFSSSGFLWAVPHFGGHGPACCQTGLTTR